MSKFKMKKTLLILGLFIFFPNLVQANSIRPELNVYVSPENKPTQRLLPGSKDVEVLRFRLTPTNHPKSGPMLESLKFKREGSDDRGQLVRYKLMNGQNVIGKISLPDTDVLEFRGLNFWIPNGNTMELVILADLSIGNLSGNHQFSILQPDFLSLSKSHVQELDTLVTGNFPILANKILIGATAISPPSDCNLREEPVCGEDGKTYFNLCIPFQKGLKIVSEDACLTPPPLPKICSNLINPVCGDDGNTYTNSCELEQYGVPFDYNGECFPDDIPVIGNLVEAVQLFEHKKNQLLQLRPRISNESADDLNFISSLLVSFDFTPGTRSKLISKVSDFLEYGQNPSDRDALAQEIHFLVITVKLAQSESNRNKYEAGEIPFLDVGAEAWFLNAVKFLKEKGWAEGYKDEAGEETGLYRPETYVTKAEITKMVLEASGISTDKLIKKRSLKPYNPFAASHWAKRIIGYAEKSEYDMWSLWPNPNKKALRGEVIRLIFEIFKIDPPYSFAKSSFSDVNKTSNNFRYIEYAKNLGIISGYGDGTFKEKEPIRRAEAAKILKNAFEIFWGSK